jgi:hypothetical protein
VEPQVNFRTSNATLPTAGKGLSLCLRYGWGLQDRGTALWRTLVFERCLDAGKFLRQLRH